MKSFNKPLEEIVVVMRSLFLLLGNTKKELTDWKAIKVLIGKTGKDGLKRRIANYVVPTTSINTPALKLAKKQIATVNIQRIQDISVGAMVFYSWASGVLDEITQNDFSLF